MSLSMGNLPKSHSEGPRRPTADGEPCLRCHLARSTMGRDGLTGTQVKRGIVSMEPGDDDLLHLSASKTAGTATESLSVDMYSYMHIYALLHRE